tara:strand:+ start:818 stop:1381 length:564 start_codon:yes stop_codon:yes gene_type:complete
MTLKLADYEKAAKELGVDVASVKAVVEVESRGEGFLDSGEPVILFERHVFNRRLRNKGIVVRDQPDIVNPVAGGYKGGAAEHKRLQRAVAIDREAALESASWGLFQIMGYHWQALGFKDLQSFINAMYKDEASHLEAFVKFIKVNRNIHKALKAKNWADFARGYNGPAYKRNRYDDRLATAYTKHLA